MYFRSCSPQTEMNLFTLISFQIPKHQHHTVHHQTLQDGPLPDINEVITPINDLTSGYNWGYNPHKVDL